MIVVADYGLGNIQAIANIYARLNVPFRVARTAVDLDGADRIILPGVGAFDWAMERLNASGMRERLDQLVTVGKRPVLGICVGMQMMARRSDEGRLAGLGWIGAEVRQFQGQMNGQQLLLPHMGWNDVAPVSAACLFRGIEAPRFYFLHSYYFVPDDPSVVLGMTDYGVTFASAVRADNVFGAQFHPEKSHGWGIDLLRNFAEM
jgi:glutamine amidotransferase